MEKTKEENKHISATGIVKRNAPGELGNKPPRGPNRSIQLKQHDLKIEVNSGSDRITQVWVRFGTKVGKEHQWGTTMAIGPVNIDPGKVETVAMMDVDQIPANAKLCQVLCEIPNEHGDPEILMTEPTPLA